MAEYCPLCFEKQDFLHKCGDSAASSFSGLSSVAGSGKHTLSSVVIAAPLMGVVLDLFVPLPSSLIHSLIVALLGSAVTGALWVAFKHDGSKSFKFFLRNLKNFIYTPNMLKIFGSDGNKKVTSSWLGVIAASIAVQILIFTPGNATYLETQISNSIDKASGANLDVECPGTQFFLYQDRIECRVKTGILGISVPARVELSPILGTSDIKVSLL